MCSLEEIQEGVRAALRKLYSNDEELIVRDVNERSVTHWFAVYLQERFPNWNVDCEYNRNGTETKRLRRLGIAPEQIDSADLSGQTVYPDIIVHHRGCKRGDANLLVIEAKKTRGVGKLDKDRKKLEGFGKSGDFAYRIGAFLLLDHSEVKIDWYQDGVCLEGPEILDLSHVVKERGSGGHRCDV